MDVDTKTPFSTNNDEEICYDKTVAYQEIVLFDSKKQIIIMNTFFFGLIYAVAICSLLANKAPIGLYFLAIGGISIIFFLYLCFPMGKKIGLDSLNRELHYKSILLIQLCKCYDQKFQVHKIMNLSYTIKNNVIRVIINFSDGSKSKMILEHGIGRCSSVQIDIIQKIDMINAWIADMKK